MSIELDTKIDGRDKGRYAQIKIDDLMSASTKPLMTLRFSDVESTFDYMNITGQYIEEHGNLSLSIATNIQYLDLIETK